MKIGSCYPGTYMKATDIGSERLFTIEAVQIEAMEQSGDDKPVLYFVAEKQGLVLNKTNAAVIADAYGEETDGWKGCPVVLYRTRTQFAGKMVDCIRIRVPSEKSSTAVEHQIQQAAADAVASPDTLPF